MFLFHLPGITLFALARRNNFILNERLVFAVTINIDCLTKQGCTYTAQHTSISTKHSTNHSHHDKMSQTIITPSLLSLPIKLIYQILDRLGHKGLFFSVRSVCQRLDAITDIYYPYQVSFTLSPFHSTYKMNKAKNQARVVDVTYIRHCGEKVS